MELITEQYKHSMALPHLANFAPTESKNSPLVVCQHSHLPSHVRRQLARSDRRSDRQTRVVSCHVRTLNSKGVSTLLRSDLCRNSLNRMLPRQRRRGAARARRGVTVSASDVDSARVEGGKGGGGTVDLVASQQTNSSPPPPPVSSKHDALNSEILWIACTEVQK